MEINKNQVIFLDDLGGDSKKVEFSVKVALDKGGVKSPNKGDFFLIITDQFDKKTFRNLDALNNNLKIIEDGILFSVSKDESDDVKSIELYQKKSMHGVTFQEIKIKFGSNLGRTFIYQEMEYMINSFESSSSRLTCLFSIYRTEKLGRLKLKIKSFNTPLIEDQPFVFLEYLVDTLGVDIISLANAELFSENDRVNHALITVIKTMANNGVTTLKDSVFVDLVRFSKLNLFFCKSISSKPLYLNEAFKKLFWTICFKSVLVGDNFSVKIYSDKIENAINFSDVTYFELLYNLLIEKMENANQAFSDEALLVNEIASSDEYINTSNFIVFDNNLTVRELNALQQSTAHMNARKVTLIELIH